MIDNGTAKTLKTIGIIIIVACVIGGVILGIQTADRYSSFNFGVALMCWVAGFISGMVLFGFGEAIDLLQLNADRQAQILEKMDKRPRQEVEKAIYSEPRTTTDAPIVSQDNIGESDNGDSETDRIMKLFDKT